jgi:phospholipid/cholesterol/gamma-HCH transport system ATP-binding protein
VTRRTTPYLRRTLGIIFQDYRLFDDRSVYDNVAFQMREHTNLSEAMIRDLVMMKLHAVGLRGAHKLMPSELSGGMARRVALARAIALDPLLMLYDEPFTGLDPIAMGVIRNLIKELNSALGATSIVVTHDVQEALEVVDYVYYLSDGKMVAHGTPDDIRHSKDPLLHQFVYGDIDGPVAYQYPGRELAEDMRLGASGSLR